jgi:electron transfer flavoprotein alpha subunit
MTVLVVAEHHQDELNGSTLELISAARDLGAMTVALVGPAAPSVVEAVDVGGVEEIVLIETNVGELDPDAYRGALSQLIQLSQPSVVLVASTPHSFSYAGALAIANGLGFASDVHALQVDGDSIVAARSFYAGKVRAELEFPGRSGVLLVLRPAVWPPASGERAGATRTTIAMDVTSKVDHLEAVQASTDGVDITKADLILAVGRGIGEQENFVLFEDLARKIGATLAVSRPLVDAGWATPDRQVGQSGKTVKPRLYLAFGISGASQHLAGMRSSETIVAVNSDPDAAIFAVADYGGVFDAVELAKELGKLYDASS